MSDDWLSEEDLQSGAPASDPLEKEIEKKGCNYAKRKGWRALKFTSPNKRSVPDRIHFKAPGRVFFIEYKRKGEKPTPKQAEEIKRLRDEGFDVFVVDNVEEAYRVIDLMETKYARQK